MYCCIFKHFFLCILMITPGKKYICMQFPCPCEFLLQVEECVSRAGVGRLAARSPVAPQPWSPAALQPRSPAAPQPAAPHAGLQRPPQAGLQRPLVSQELILQSQHPAEPWGAGVGFQAAAAVGSCPGSQPFHPPASPSPPGRARSSALRFPGHTCPPPR